MWCVFPSIRRTTTKLMDGNAQHSSKAPPDRRALRKSAPAPPATATATCCTEPAAAKYNEKSYILTKKYSKYRSHAGVGGAFFRPSAGPPRIWPLPGSCGLPGSLLPRLGSTAAGRIVGRSSGPPNPARTSPRPPGHSQTRTLCRLRRRCRARVGGRSEGTQRSPGRESFGSCPTVGEYRSPAVAAARGRWLADPRSSSLKNAAPS
mmetsp:Transcript_12925/g.31491  ORF Transcript_12925/g.31491 Transcript_12925/m.31491 type:complete len:206 (+) Transcript_12925:46-663(+)